MEEEKVKLELVLFCGEEEQAVRYEGSLSIEIR